MKDIIKMTIGEKIKELRNKHDLTQEKLADYLFVSYQAVSKWECGLSNPDLNLIAPLTKLFNVTSDELLGLTPKEETDARYEELKKLYQETWQTGDQRKRYEICKVAICEYPGDMFFLSELAWAEAMLSFKYEDEKEYIEAQEKAIRIFARVIEDCKDSSIRNHSVTGIVQYLSFRGRYDEAKKYLELYPNGEYSSKVELMDYCLVGEEKIAHHQKLLDNLIYKILNNLGTCSIESIEAQEKIINAIIVDQNYLGYNDVLYNNYLAKAKIYIKASEFDKAIEALQKAKYYALEYDKLMKKESYQYTSPFLNRIIVKTKEICSCSLLTWHEGFIEDIQDDIFNPIKDRTEYKKLFEKEVSLMMC